MASVKLSDIAHKLGTSTVTVSNAVNGKGSISPELRKKILKTAKEMGYKRRSKDDKKAAEDKVTIAHTPLSDPLEHMVRPYDPAELALTLSPHTGGNTHLLHTKSKDLAATAKNSSADRAEKNLNTQRSAQKRPTLGSSTEHTDKTAQTGRAARSGKAAHSSSAQEATALENEITHNRQIGILIAQRYISVGASFYWNLYQLTATTAATCGISSTLLQVSDEQIEQGQLPHLLNLLTRPQKLNDNKALHLDGLIIMGPFAHSYLKLLSKLPIPCTLLDYYDEDLDLSAVLSHNYINSYQITRYVIKKGHTRIGFIGNRIGFENIADRFYGFERALILSGLEVKSEWVLDDRDPVRGKIYDPIPLPPSFVPLEHNEPIEVKQSTNATERTIRASVQTSMHPTSRVPEHMPTVFVCNCDYSAGMLQRALIQRGFRVPEDISIVGYDNFSNDSLLAHELTTLDVNQKLMAKFAVSNIINLLSGKMPANHIRRLEGYIIERRSVITLRH